MNYKVLGVIIFVSLFMFISGTSAQSLGNTDKSVVDLGSYPTSTKTNWKEFPDRATPMESTNLDDRLKILPTGDNGEKSFIVYPKVGLIAPLLDTSMADADKISRNKKFDHYTYLEKGVLQYTGPQIGELGTAIIAGHSSFRDHEYNPYYTVFQAVPLSGLDDEIWVYVRDEEAVTRYIYEIQESYEADPSQRALVEDQKEYSSITTYSCYPIGSNKSRRVNHASLVGTEIMNPQMSDTHTQEKIEKDSELHHSPGEEDPVQKIDRTQDMQADKTEIISVSHASTQDKKATIKAEIKARNTETTKIEQPTQNEYIYTDTKVGDPVADHTAASVSILDRDTITVLELVNIYMGAKHSVYKKQLLIKLVTQIKQQKKKLIGVPSFD